MKKRILFLCVLALLSTTLLQAQIAINNTASSPDPSAMLDISATDKGVLIPRTDTTSVSNPVAGLMIFDPTDKVFRVYNGTHWFTYGGDGKNISIGYNLIHGNTPNEYSTAVGYDAATYRSFATSVGYDNSAGDEGSNSIGYKNYAGGKKASAMGSGNRAEEDFSNAFGYNNKAEALISEAFGSNNTINRSGGMAYGRSNFTSANYGQAFGIGLNASVYCSTVIGRYNADQSGSSLSWFALDPIFEIGNGEDNSNRSTALTILKNGNMGINTPQPEYKLTVEHETISSPGFGSEGVMIKNNGTNDRSWYHYVVNNTGNYNWYQGGTNSPKAAVDVTTGNWVPGSDKRIKSNIQSLNSKKELSKLMQVRPTSYQFKGAENQRTAYGVIAQELQEVYPEMVIEMGEEKGQQLGVSYTELIPVLISAVQEQQAIIEELKERIETLENK